MQMKQCWENPFLWMVMKIVQKQLNQKVQKHLNKEKNYIGKVIDGDCMDKIFLEVIASYGFKVTKDNYATSFSPSELIKYGIDHKEMSCFCEKSI
jgi:hypothetical protein